MLWRGVCESLFVLFPRQSGLAFIACSWSGNGHDTGAAEIRAFFVRPLKKTSSSAPPKAPGWRERPGGGDEKDVSGQLSCHEEMADALFVRLCLVLEACGVPKTPVTC